MRLVPLAALAVLVGLAEAQAQATPDVRVGGVALGAPAADVLRALGPPDSTHARLNEFSGDSVRVHVYGPSEVHTERGAFSGFRLRDASLAFEGLGLGDLSVGDAAGWLDDRPEGIPSHPSSSGPPWISFQIGVADEYVQVVRANGWVTEIRTWCDC